MGPELLEEGGGAGARWDLSSVTSTFALVIPRSFIRLFTPSQFHLLPLPLEFPWHQHPNHNSGWKHLRHSLGDRSGQSLEPFGS